MRFEVSERGADRQKSRLTTLSHRLEHPEPGLRHVADVLRAGERRRFRTRGDGSWRPNRPSTVEQKGSARVLVMSGATERSLTVKGAPGSVEQVSGFTLRFGTTHLAGHSFLTRRWPLFRSSRQLAKPIASRFGRWLLEGIA